MDVLSAFTSVQVDGGRWAIVSQIDHDEVLQWAAGGRRELIPLLLLGYGLALWSAWYLRRAVSGQESGMELVGALDLDVEAG